MRSEIPLTWQYACSAIDSGRASASKARTKIWFSSMPVSPSLGSEDRIAGPPVLKENSWAPPRDFPASVVTSVLSLNVHFTPAGKSRTKS